VLPALTAAVVAFALFVLGAERSVLAARVYGGPTEGRREHALRIVVAERHGDSETPYRAARVHVGATNGRERRGPETTATLDDRGVADVTVSSPAGGMPTLHVRDGQGHTLAGGAIRLSESAWHRRAERHGGPIRASIDGALTITATPVRGLFALGFPGTLEIQLRDASGGAVASELVLESDGADLAESSLRTNAAGVSRVSLTATEPVAMLRIRAARGSATGSWYGRLPVRMGALHADYSGGLLRIASATPRERAYVSIVAADGKLLGLTTKLTATTRGAVAELPLAPPRAASWAVVSSEPDLLSPSTTGWPLDMSSVATPRDVWTARDALLLDGMPAAVTRERERRRGARQIASTMSAVALLLTMTLVAYDFRRSRLPEELRAVLGARRSRAHSAVGNAFYFVVALLCIALGFGVVALLSYVKLG
jgi:hypothetical protein